MDKEMMRSCISLDKDLHIAKEKPAEICRTVTESKRSLGGRSWQRSKNEIADKDKMTIKKQKEFFMVANDSCQLSSLERLTNSGGKNYLDFWKVLCG